MFADFKGFLINTIGVLFDVGTGAATIIIFMNVISAKSKLMNSLRNGAKGLTQKARDRAESTNFFQRRKLADEARKVERRRSNIADYAHRITGTRRRDELLRRRAAGGMVGQVLNTNQAGQQRQRLGGVAQLEKQEHEETQQAGLLIEHSQVTGPEQLARIISGGEGVGVGGQIISGAGNPALQRAALQKLIKTQDARELEHLFTNTYGQTDKQMVVSELQKEQNYSTSKGAGAHLVQMQARDYTQPEVQEQAMVSMAGLKAGALASQDGPAWESAFTAFHLGMGTLDQRRAFWDASQRVLADPNAMSDVKGSARYSFDSLTDPAHPNYHPRP